jgi:hypothetical protein
MQPGNVRFRQSLRSDRSADGRRKIQIFRPVFRVGKRCRARGWGAGSAQKLRALGDGAGTGVQV